MQSIAPRICEFTHRITAGGNLPAGHSAGCESAQHIIDLLIADARYQKGRAEKDVQQRNANARQVRARELRI